VTEFVFPLENLLSNDTRPQKDQTVGSTVDIVSQQTLDKLCAQNQVIAAIGSRKRDRSSHEQQFLSTTTATNEDAMYESGGNGNDAAIVVERETKALKTNKDSCCTATAKPYLAEQLQLQHTSPNQIVTRTDNLARDYCSSQVISSNSARRKRLRASSEKTEIEAAINSTKKIPERNDLYSEKLVLTALQQQKQSSSKSSKTFQKRIEELRAFKAKFGHCNVTVSKSVSNKPYLSLGEWCANVRHSPRLIEEGKQKQARVNLSKAEIERLDAVGFQWKLKSACDERIEELRAFKAKFGHCNVTVSKSVSNKPYLPLGQWCSEVRHSRRLIEEGKQKQARVNLSKAEIERLDAVGFQWKLKSACDKRIEELRAFKAKFGHCNVTRSKSASNKPYVSLGRWCSEVRRHSRRLIEEGKQKQESNVNLTKAEIERLDAVGFQWKLKSACSYDERIEELRAFKAKFGHCNVTRSTSASNKPYVSLGRWCSQVRHSRRLIEEGKQKQARVNLSKALIECLDALGFQWKLKSACCDGRMEKLTTRRNTDGYGNRKAYM
jgi:uncharacterized small protein (DUF1192 family)